MDVDHSGELAGDDLQHLFPENTRAELEEMIREVTSDKGSKLTFEQFKKMMQTDYSKRWGRDSVADDVLMD